MSVPPDDLHHHDSDSDAVSDAPTDDYRPISVADSDGDDDDPPPADALPSNGRDLSDSGELLPNGVGDGDDAAEEEEEKRMAAADRAASQAFREDEERRAAPLTAENAARVVEAMRGIAFPGVLPDWAGRVSEDRWMDQLRRLREP